MGIREYLQKLDLSEKEINVYLACLKIGQTTLFEVSQKSGLAKMTTRYILEKLDELGLIEIVMRGKRRSYQALPPRNVLSLLRKKQILAKEQADSFEEFLPELNQLYSSSALDPQIRFYRGEEIRKIYEDLLDSPIDEYCYVGESSSMASAVGQDWLNRWIKRRIVKQIRARAIRVRSQELDHELHLAGKQNLRQLRFAPDGFKSPCLIMIYGDKVAVITSSKESIGTLTISRDYAIAMRSWFEQLWKNCEIDK